MNEPQLELFSLEGFKRRLNLALETSLVELGKFQYKKKFFKNVETFGEYSLLKIPKVDILNPLYSFYPRRKIGYILVEAGFIDPSSDYSRGYESIKLRIKHHLKLRNGKIIPKCSVEISKYVEEGIESTIERKDHIIYGWDKEKRDLRDILPNEWFFDFETVSRIAKSRKKI